MDGEEIIGGLLRWQKESAVCSQLASCVTVHALF